MCPLRHYSVLNKALMPNQVVSEASNHILSDLGKERLQSVTIQVKNRPSGCISINKSPQQTVFIRPGVACFGKHLFCARITDEIRFYTHNIQLRANKNFPVISRQDEM